MIPFQHQIEDTQKIIDNPYFALLNEMGTGKSKTIIDAIQNHLRFICTHAVIVCPKTVISSWVNTHIPLNFETYNLNVNFKWIKKSESSNPFTFVILNYEKLRNEQNFKKIEKLLKTTFCVMILDESQKVANPKAQITKRVLKLSLLASRRYILSGTPIRKNPLDYYTQFKFLHPDILGFKSWYAFRGRYAIMGGYKVMGMPVQVVGFRELDELRKKVMPYFIRRTKEQCLDLPEQLYQVQETELDKEAAKVYKDMEEHALSMIGDDTIAVTVKITQILKLRQITAGFLKDGESVYDFTNHKLKLLQEIDVEKLVIFCVFHHEIDSVLKNHSSDDGCLEISGRITGRKRESNILDFQQTANPRIVVQVETGGLGIDLHAAHTAIYLSNHYNWDVRTQSESRIHRIGQNHKCTYIDVLATINGKQTIDHDILHVIQKKKNFADYMLKEKAWN